MILRPTSKTMHDYHKMVSTYKYLSPDTSQLPKTYNLSKYNPKMIQFVKSQKKKIADRHHVIKGRKLLAAPVNHLVVVFIS